MVRPLRYDSGNLQQMTDANIDRLLYYLRVAFADQLNNSGDGYVYVGSGNTDIGTANDTSATQQSASVTRIVNDGIIQTYPAAPGTGTEIDNAYNFRQDRTEPSAPTTDQLNKDGYLFYDSGNLTAASTNAHFYDELISQCITDMRTGDEVGTYRISSTTPTNGGAGTWTDKGTVFVDSTYSAGSTTYKLWLKTALDTVPGSDVFPVGLDSDLSGNIRERIITDNSRLIRNVLLPTLTRNMDANPGLYYTVSSTQTGENRGAFTDTKQTASTTSDNFDGTFYTRTSTPSGAAVTQTTYYLNLITS
jgi:hypothetical protein